MTLLKKISLLAFAAAAVNAPVHAITGELLTGYQTAEQFGQLNTAIEANLHLQAVQDWIRTTNDTTTIVPLLLRTLERKIAHEKNTPQALTSNVMTEILTQVVRVIFLAYVDEIAQEVHIGNYRPKTPDFRVSTLLSSYLCDQLALLKNNPVSGYQSFSRIVKQAEPFFLEGPLRGLATPTWVLETAGSYSLGLRGYYVSSFTFGDCKDNDKELYTDEKMQAALLVTRQASVDELLRYFETLDWDTFLLNYTTNKAALRTRAETLASIATALREAHQQTDGTTTVSFEMPVDEEEVEATDGGSSSAPAPVLSPRLQSQTPPLPPAEETLQRQQSNTPPPTLEPVEMPQQQQSSTAATVTETAIELAHVTLHDAPPSTATLTDSMETQRSPRTTSGIISSAKAAQQQQKATEEEAEDSDTEMDVDEVEENTAVQPRQTLPTRIAAPSSSSVINHRQPAAGRGGNGSSQRGGKRAPR